MEVTDRVHVVAHGWEVNRIKDHEGDDVFINVSTGTNIAGIAGMMAAQTSDATPYYVQHQTPGGDGGDEIRPPDEPIFPKAGPISELPVFELQGPSAEQLQILGYLYGNETVTKKELIQFAEEQELPFIADTEAKSDEGRYRLLESHIIDPLTEGGFVRIEKAGREKHVLLEDRGVDALAAFPLDSTAIDSVESSQENAAEDSETLGGAGSVDFRDTISFKDKTEIDED